MVVRPPSQLSGPQTIHSKRPPNTLTQRQLNDDPLARAEAARERRKRYREELFYSRWSGAQRSQPLRGGCVESRFDIGCQFGPVPLEQCIERCEQHRFEYLRRMLPDQGGGQWREEYPSASSQALQSPLGGSCGAVGFYKVEVPQVVRRGHAELQSGVGFCQLKALFCKEPPYSVRFGNCTDSIRWSRRVKRGWCTHLLGPLPNLSNRPKFAHRPSVLADLHARCAPERELGATNVTLPQSQQEYFASNGWHSTRSARWLDRSRPKSAMLAHNAALPAEPVYYEPVGNGQIAVLGGGLNNMLMGLSQLLTDSCQMDGVLLLPPLDADPLRESNFQAGTTKECAAQTRRSSRVVCSWTERPRADLVAFGDVFDLAAFQQRLWPALCAICNRSAWCGEPRPFVQAEAPKTARVAQITLAPLRSDWGAKRYAPMLAAVYNAAQPSASVRTLVDVLIVEAKQRAGPRWAAVHLPIEKDWWWGSDWCHGRKEELYTRRCYAPAEVALLTRRARSDATGTVLLYAYDKAARRDSPWTWETHNGQFSEYGPPVCLDAFGSATFKLQLPSHIPYTFRNAAELFFAARAPAGFFGNSYSTFSKGIALLRATPGRDGRSYAYDCALREKGHWQPSAQLGIVANHPGFIHLRPLSNASAGAVAGTAAGAHDDHCGTAFNAPELTTVAAVRELVSKYRAAHLKAST